MMCGSKLIEKPLLTMPAVRLVVATPVVIEVEDDATYEVCRPTWIGAGWLFRVVTLAEVTVDTLPWVASASMMAFEPAHDLMVEFVFCPAVLRTLRARFPAPWIA